MSKNRLEAFSDGVLAIIITIMVLELKVPHGDQLSDLLPLWPVLLSYVLSFTFVGIYWNNHHHMLHAIQHVSGSVLLANLGLLFWLSLIPFATGWMGENHFAPVPVAFYGLLQLMAATFYWVLQQRCIATQGANSLLQQAIGNDWKGKISLLAFAVAVALSFIHTGLALAVYGGISVMWLIPDRRIERALRAARTG
ncbi:TMEM175 family protein [Roseateles sp. BYS180W]|uniref:TMEM175 family protein n=1 Tax=Roseateles rivi TaxID=3299028 RepID=A0ABW7FX59_9BURK